MTLTIEAVTRPSQRARFLTLPVQLYRDLPNFIPPLLMERREALSPRKNPYFTHAEAAMFLAKRGDQIVGRISAQHDRLGRDTRQAQFGLLAAIDDAAVVGALLGAAEGWARTRGFKTLSGPFNLSINESIGLLVDGFDTPPMMMTEHDPPYLARHVAAAGFETAFDVFGYLCDTARMPPGAEALLARGLPPGVTLRPMRPEALQADIASLVSIFNDAWADNRGFVPITEAEIDAMARQLKPLIEPDLIWFAERAGEPVAFAVCLRDLNHVIRDLGGRLLPVGWAKLLWRLKLRPVSRARVPLMGVRRDVAATLSGRLLPLFLVRRVQQAALDAGIDTVELSWVLEENQPMRHLAEAVGGRRYKTWRIFEKTLA
jgi:hypothetical protein